MLSCKSNLFTAAITLYSLWSVFAFRGSLSELYDSIAFYKLILLISVYFMTRFMSGNYSPLLCICIVGVMQSICAISQWIGVLQSNNIYFPVTGFMGNPGQMGGFQAVSFVCSVLLLQSMRTVCKKIFGYVFIVLILFSLILSDSRASFCAVIIGVVIVYHELFKKIFLKYKWLIGIVIFIVFFLILMLCDYRVKSVESRILIWHISINMIKDRPLCGFGYGGFNRNYMLYQADYFNDNITSPFALVADNAFYPYNEFLNITVNQGIIGLFLFIFMLITAFASARDKSFTAPLFTLMTFSFFSYPFSKLSLAIILPFCLGLLHPSTISCKSHRVYGLILSTFAICFTMVNISWCRHSFDQMLLNVYKFKNQVSFAAARAYFKQNSYDLETNLRYSSLLERFPEYRTNEDIAMLFPTCENRCILGEFYLNLKEYDMAEEALKIAANMVPTRLRPHYLLWQLYVSKQDTASAYNQGLYILSMPLKVENTYTLKVKYEIENYLNAIQ